MYKTFLKIIVVIIGVFYIASFCEFDRNESRQNYDNETHAYIHVDNVNAKLIKLPVDAKQLCTVTFRINIPSQTFISNQYSDFYSSVLQSHNKKYLFNSVFLI